VGQFGAEITGSDGLAASTVGIWFSGSPGMTAEVSVLTHDGKTAASVAGANSGGARVTVSENTAWIMTGYDTITCADGTTGRAIAATSITPSHAQVESVTAYQSSVYGIYHLHGASELVKIDAPQSCTS
jgi:hypothetical protein